MNYDIAISNYFNQQIFNPFHKKKSLRYGENPHQQAIFYGDLNEAFTQLHGKEISYNNLVDVDAAIQLINEFNNKSMTTYLRLLNIPMFAALQNANTLKRKLGCSFGRRS